jgi:hypothetical protein
MLMALFYGVIGDAGSAGIVGLNGCDRLGMTHVSKGSSQPCGFLAIVEDGFKFGFGGGGDNHFEDGTGDVDVAVSGWWWSKRVDGCGMGSQSRPNEKKASNTAA